MRIITHTLLYLGLLSLCLCSAYAEQPADALLDMNLADLLDLEVTSAGKKRQKIAELPNAVTVITADDIRRSGATHIGELLRHVPGIQAAQLNAYDWLIAARGTYNSVYANKLLVLIDGRSVYNLQLATVYWDVVNLPLESVERIEVIRGPGGTLWGANAVNGVINIITKSAHDMQGTQVHADAGAQIQNASVHHGGKLNADTAYRVYGQTRHSDNSKHGYQDDSRRFQQAGFHLDTLSDETQHFSVQGDVYSGLANDMDWSNLQAGDTKEQGGNLLARWQSGLGSDRETMLQAYYDYTEWQRPTYRVTNQVLDFEAQRRYRFERHELLLGLGYRWLYSNVPPESQIQRPQAERRDNLFNAFVQDEIQLIPARLNLIVGTKFEHNDYTGFNFQPSVRLLWLPSTDLTLWGAVSNAIRTPSQVSDHIDFTMQVPNDSNPFYPLPTYTRLQGNPDLVNESVLTAEIGARQRVNPQWSWDMSAFYSHYDDVMILINRPEVDFSKQSILLQGYYVNGMQVDSYGVELAINWQHADWQAQLAYSWLDIAREQYAQYAAWPSDLGRDNPTHKASVHLSKQFGPDWRAGIWLRYISTIPHSFANVDAQLNTDVKLSWQVNKQLSLALAGQNIFDPAHYEYQRTSFYPHVTEIPRSIYLQLDWQFN